MEVYGRADVHLEPKKDPMLHLANVPKGDRDTREVQLGAGSSQKILLHGQPMLEQSVPEDCTVWKGGAICEKLQPIERNYTGEVHGRLSPMRDIPGWSMGRV
ncbi:hypothetical protein DUI87_16339 [Hirundo rustica rustica]|uniref:Uncharacterized protein n=1 Tax=Hirundo rustica rustica TaxID=333673 RepID=A0A3M0K0U0_HIRRU|nr:hypothetical protein DUI87_16339 [Hirundo rustica rustica]